MTLIMITVDARANTSELFGNTLECTEDKGTGSETTMRFYVTQNRLFQYYANEQPNVGIIYEFGRTRNDKINQNASYTSQAKLEPLKIELSSNYQNKNSSFVHGKTHFVKGQIRITFENKVWVARREYRQWSSGGGRMYSPTGSHTSICVLLPGRVGL